MGAESDNAFTRKTLTIALIGYGKMGKAIEAIAIQKGHRIGLKVDIHSQEAFTRDNLRQCDVAIEFTGPQSAAQNILTCLEAGLAVVSGSTGWLSDWETVKEKCIAMHGSMIYASNYSIGVNMFFELNTLLARLMAPRSEYDVSMVEIHHTEKRDAPSGTAITLAEQVLQHVERKKAWVNHAPASADELPITSERIDPAPGTHKVKYSSAVDDIEIIHTAHNRQGFASGAVLAAEFIHGKTGVFSMKDVLGF